MDSEEPRQPVNHGDVVSEYQRKLDRESEQLRSLSSRWKAFAFTRGGAFLICLVPLFFAARTLGGVNVPWLILSGVLFLVFLILAFIHERMSRQIRLSRLLVRMHEESIARIERRLDRVQTPAFAVAAEVEPVSNDLDLFGPFSLYHLLGTPRTPFGCQILGDWISYPAKANEVQVRQIAVEELKPQQQWRHEFRLRCEQLAASQSGPSQFVGWAEGGNWVQHRPALLWFCRLTALVSLVSIAMVLTGLMSLTMIGPTLMVSTFLNFTVSVFYAGAMHDIFNQISSHRNEFRHYENLFSEIVKFETVSPFLKSVQHDLTGRGVDVRQQIRELGFWNELANFRRNGIFFIAYLLFEFLFMWDIHILERMERWKQKHGTNVRLWFEALGRWESILALSKLAYDNPTWTFPRITQGGSVDQIECTRLGHPLMDDSRVTNDVSVGPTGTVLLVSGSNMSGKSTLLRSLGVNAVLAQMGSVVCAESMKLPQLRIETSMRIVDSLAMGTSFFMAELKRLKEIVDLAKQYQRDNETMLLFLLDEILQGTNSRERQIAVSKVVESLLEYGAIGAISTHDLELAATQELKDACVPVHFAEQFEEVDGNKKMTFDYKMKTGISETTNALKLLELVGLSDST